MNMFNTGILLTFSYANRAVMCIQKVFLSLKRISFAPVVLI
jgi:hypothetical protein